MPTLRKMLGLPEAETPPIAPPAYAEGGHNGTHTGTDDDNLGDGYQVVPRQSRRREEPAGTLGTIALETEPGRERWGRRLLRILLISVLILLLFLGIRTVVRPAAAPPAYQPPAASAYDRGAAQAVAARWAESYLTLSTDDKNGSIRSTALALDAAAGADTGGGVNVTQSQTVLEIQPGQVDVAPDGQTSVVTVLARVKSGETAARWVALAVPIASDGRRLVVPAAGAFVALPTPGVVAAKATKAPDEDSSLSTTTRASAAAWFSAYGGVDQAAVSAISAPGATISPLGGLTVKNLDTWAVYAGDTSTRRARATVTWATPSGDLHQSYDLTLSAVRSGDTTDWRVLAVTASTTR